MAFLRKFLIITITAVFFGRMAVAQQHQDFYQRPSKRQEKLQAAQQRFDADQREAKAWAQARGLKMRHVDGDRVSELIAIRNGRPVYNVTENKNAAISSGAASVRTTVPFSVDGSGFRIGLWDGGTARATHDEFDNRVHLGDAMDTDSHATHVCGTLAASGDNILAKGMAPSVNIESYDWNNAEDEMISIAAASAGNTNQIHLSNHSYGIVSGWIYGSYSGNTGYHWYGNSISDDESDNFGQYGSLARSWDDIVYDAPYYLPFKSAGNDRTDNPPSNGTTFYYYSGGWQSAAYDSSIHPPGDGDAEGGYDTIGPRGNAKNIITVGSVGDAVSGGNRDPDVASMSSYSGWGPADDGRIKPDIVANGEWLTSTESGSDSSYGSKSGTSMSSPNACGSAALLIDYYDDRFPGKAMRASTLKGLIIHTADDLGRPGPDYSYGWGLMNTLAAAEHIKEYADGNLLRITEAVLHSTTNHSDTYGFYSPGVEAVRVTLCWTDPPGTSSSSLDDRSAKLVNDLDLKITGPGGTYYPYKLSYASPSANATANSENNVDNVEQVYIETPTPGSYTVEVDYDGVLTDGLQHYSLLISGNINDADLDNIPDYWEFAYFSSVTGAVASVDSDGDGLNNWSEYVAGTIPTDAGSVFEVVHYEVMPADAGRIITWSPSVEGRIYNVLWSDNLLFNTFTNNDLSGDLPYPANSYTDTVNHVSDSSFYRIDVRLDQ